MAAKDMEEIAAYMKTMRFRKKFIGGVDVVVRAAAAVESELMPFSAGSVVREKEYKCVFQLPVVAQCFDKAADIAIHDVDHGCINSHTAC